jgi:hypothetical protein
VSRAVPAANQTAQKVQTSSDGYTSDRAILLCMVLVAISWGVLGWIDLPHQAKAGFDTNGLDTVTAVQAGSPAEAAGLRPGDVITHFDGVPLDNATAIARMPRKNPGEVLNLAIEREGQASQLFIAFAPPTERSLNLARASLIIAGCFLLIPVFAFYRKPCTATRVLAMMGFGLSFAFMTGPYIADFGARALAMAATSLFVLFGVVATLQFLLVFPEKRPWVSRTHQKILLYLPAFLLWLLLTYRVVWTPAATSGLNWLTQSMAAVVIGGYLLTCLFRVLRNHSRTHRAQRQALALNAMLLATVAGIVPVTIAQLIRAFSPHAALPGQDYYFVTLVLIPFAWARSASRWQPDGHP